MHVLSCSCQCYSRSSQALMAWQEGAVNTKDWASRGAGEMVQHSCCDRNYLFLCLYLCIRASSSNHIQHCSLGPTQPSLCRAPEPMCGSEEDGSRVWILVSNFKQPASVDQVEDWVYNWQPSEICMWTPAPACFSYTASA